MFGNLSNIELGSYSIVDVYINLTAYHKLDQVTNAGKGLHSFTSWLNLSAFCGIGVHSGVIEEVFRRCQGVLRSISGCLGCILCQKRLRLS